MRTILMRKKVIRQYSSPAWYHIGGKGVCVASHFDDHFPVPVVCRDCPFQSAISIEQGNTGWFFYIAINLFLISTQSNVHLSINREIFHKISKADGRLKGKFFTCIDCHLEKEKDDKVKIKHLLSQYLNIFVIELPLKDKRLRILCKYTGFGQSKAHPTSSSK